VEVGFTDFINGGNVASYHDRHNLPMTFSELEEIIDRAERDEVVGLYLHDCNITTLPESIGKLHNLKVLALSKNKLISLPESIGNLVRLCSLCLSDNQLTSLPESIGRLTELKNLNLDNNRLNSLPTNIAKLRLWSLNLENNQLEILPNFTDIGALDELNINNNPLTDLSPLQELYTVSLHYVTFLGCHLDRRYWTKLSEWKAEWLLDEKNAEVRRILIKQIGYEKICQDLRTTTIDIWREYTLLKIDNTEIIYEDYTHWAHEELETFYLEPIALLKMNCPSTGHIHILRVPPQITSAEQAITWVNHGIHPDRIAFAT
jgi:leucine-rich repeat protein SHOC2